MVLTESMKFLRFYYKVLDVKENILHVQDSVYGITRGLKKMLFQDFMILISISTRT